MQFLKKLFYKSLSIRLQVTSSNGFHLRPIAQFVNKAKSFDATIEIEYTHLRVNAKKINTLLSLSLDKKDTFILHSHGKEAQEALEALTVLFEELMHNDIEVFHEKSTRHSYEGDSIEAEIVFKGIAIAPLALLQKEERKEESDYGFEEALSRSIADLSQGSNTIEEAQKTLLLSIAEEAEDLKSFEKHILETCKKLENSKQASKIADYQDIEQRVKSYLGFKSIVTFPKEEFILLAQDLLPSQITALSQTQVKGVILQNTSIYAHTAILLRTLGIASLILDKAILQEGEILILDSHAGLILPRPSKDDIQKAKEAQKNSIQEKKQSYSTRFDTAYTKAKQKISVYANVSDSASAKIAKEEGAEGIGLLRSEFLFQENKPSLEMQTQSYKEIFEIFEDVTVRTLDVGGDKALPYIEIDKEDNPFLGIRGIRLFKTHPQILKEQLQAIFLASQNKAIKVMFPMVSTVEEFVEAKEIAQEVAKEKQIDISSLQFGIMIEVPSVLFLLEDFNKVVDFYSIGSNDLAQYLFATERTHALLKIDPLSPVIFSSIAHIMQKAKKPVSICGELASNEKAIATLIKLGIETLSVSPKTIASTKERIRNV